MGLFTGSTKTTTSSTSNSGPSQFQAPYLTGAFDAAQSLYNSKAGTPYYQGETYAGMSDQAKQALSDLKSYASSTGLGTAGTLSSLGSTLAANGTKAGSTLDAYTAAAQQDPTQANIAAATQYANNPALNAQIDAASRDVTRNLSEVQLPSIDRAASASGNINSSRAGVASGIAQRGAADQMADTAATMRGQAYQQGLTMADQDHATTLNALAQAANGYGSLAGQGFGALGQGNSMALGSYDAINQANTAEQADRQGQDTANFNQWQGQDTRDQDLLNNYMGVVGGQQWGQSSTSSGTSTTTQTQSLLNQLLAIASTAGGVAKSFSGSPKS